MRYIFPVLLCCAAYGQLPVGVIGGSPVAGNTVATPTGSPVAGTYGPTQTVTLSDATSGATICNTIDGSTPGAATPGTCDGAPTSTYSTPLIVAATTTIKAIGTKAAMTNSGILSSLYTIAPGRQFLVPTAYFNDSGTTRQFLVPGVGYLNAGR